MSSQPPASENIYDEEPLTSTVKPDTMATITVRLIKSFSYRTVKNHIFHNIDLTTTTVAQLLEKAREIAKSGAGFRAYRTHADLFDTVKVYTHAHGTKTMNLVVNFEHDADVKDETGKVVEKSWVLTDGNQNLTLKQCGVENETELSVFVRKEYEEFKQNPEEKWI